MRFTWLTFMAAATISVMAMAQDAPKPESPFDKVDPEIEFLKTLKWEDVDFDKADLETRTYAIMALNRLVGVTAEKAAKRLEYINRYLDQSGLRQEMLNDGTKTLDMSDAFTYEQGKKLALALIQTPQGASLVDGSLDGVSDEAITKSFVWYDKSARARWGQMVFQRYQIVEICAFLDRKGKFEEAVAWARAERDRNKEQDQKELAERHAKAQEQERIRAAAAAKRADERYKLEHEKSLKRMDYSFQLQQSRIAAHRDIRVAQEQDNYYYWGDND